MLVSNFIAIIKSKTYYFTGWLKASAQGVALGRGARVSPKAKIHGVAYIGNALIASEVRMGRGSYINSGIIASGEIGQYCSIAYNVLIGPTEHVVNRVTTSPYEAVELGLKRGVTLKLVAPPIIKDGVWIGANVVVLRGVTIGERSVIAAGAIVTKDIPPYEVWGGVPARKIRDVSGFVE